MGAKAIERLVGFDGQRKMAAADQNISLKLFDTPRVVVALAPTLKKGSDEFILAVLMGR